MFQLMCHTEQLFTGISTVVVVVVLVTTSMVWAREQRKRSRAIVALRYSGCAALPAAATIIEFDIRTLWASLAGHVWSFPYGFGVLLPFWLVVGGGLLFLGLKSVPWGELTVYANLVRVGHGVVWLGGSVMALEALLGV